MVDLITVGRIGIDLFYKGDAIDSQEREVRLRLGEKYFVDELYERVGGGGANVAAAAVKNGAKAAVLGFVGNNPFKSTILEKLQTLGIDTSFCQFKDNYLNISSIFLMSSGERTIVDYETPHKEIFEAESRYDLLEQTNAVYLGSLPDVPLAEREQLLKNSKNKLTVVNLGARDCKLELAEISAFLDPVDVLIMNRVEFSTLAKISPKELNLKESIHGKMPSLATKLVIITDGANGSYGYTKDSSIYQEAKRIDRVVDTTGAGDAYTGAFIACYLKTNNLKQSMEEAASYAAYIIAKIGAN